LQIDPNLSRVPVPDERFDLLVEKYKPKSVMPAVLTVTDIAGLVKGASEGAGLGNAFLSHIQAVDGIYHVCRAFESDEVIHVEGSVAPTRDLDIIHNELLKKDIAMIRSKMEPMVKQLARGSKEAKEEYALLEKLLKWMEDGHDVRMGEWAANEVEHLNRYQLLTAKPVIYLVNMSEKGYIAKKSKFLPLLADWLKARGTDDKMIPFSCEFEGKVRACGHAWGRRPPAASGRVACCEPPQSLPYHR
jgi:obg-like ATPase 1